MVFQPLIFRGRFVQLRGPHMLMGLLTATAAVAYEVWQRHSFVPWSCGTPVGEAESWKILRMGCSSLHCLTHESFGKSSVSTCRKSGSDFPILQISLKFSTKNLVDSSSKDPSAWKSQKQKVPF